MTAYVWSTTTTASFSPGGSSAASISFALSPVLYEVKLLQIEYTLTNVNDTYGGAITPTMQFAPTLYRYSTGTASSGTSATPVALRQNAPASSMTARWGTGVSVSGTQNYIASPSPMKSTPNNDIGATYTCPFDLTVQAGGVLLFTTGSIGGSGAGGYTNSGRIQVTAYVEEYRLAWHY